MAAKRKPAAPPIEAPVQPLAELTVPYALEDVQREKQVRAGQKMRNYFPDTGRYRRALYPKHVAFMDAGKSYRERAFICANRIGKTVVGAYETACHMTGEYPAWWTGKRFTKATRGWVGGDTGKTLREIVQHELLGPEGQHGTGMLPAGRLHHVSRRPGLSGGVDTVYVRHIDGNLSTLLLKAYEEGRKSFQGAAIDFAWLDEEPPLDIYTETLLRTATTDGIIYLTFTPLQGWTPLIDQFFGDDTDRYSEVAA